MISAALTLIVTGVALVALATWRWFTHDDGDFVRTFNALVVFGIGALLLLIGLFLALAASATSLFAP